MAKEDRNSRRRLASLEASASRISAPTDSGIKWQTLEYPLIDLQITRQDCINIIRDAGLPVPPKSSCWFCPYHTKDDRRRIKTETPDIFQQAIELEDHEPHAPPWAKTRSAYNKPPARPKPSPATNPPFDEEPDGKGKGW